MGKTMTNLKKQVSNEQAMRPLRVEPQGAPFWKYTPSTKIIDPEKRSHKFPDFNEKHDQRMPELSRNKEGEAQGPEQLRASCSKYARKTHNLNKKLAVYKICNDTILDRSRDLQTDEPDSDGCESPLMSRKKKKLLK